MLAAHLPSSTRGLIAWVCVAACLASACSRRAAVNDDSGAAALMRNLLCSPGVDVEFAPGPADSSVLDSLTRAAGRAGTAFDLEYRVVTPPASDAGRRARVVLGTSEDARTRALAGRLGLTLGTRDQGPFFQWRDLPFGDPRDGLIATFEDPERPGLPLTLYLANSTAVLPGYVGELEAGWRPWVRMFSAGELVLSGPLLRSGAVVASRLDRPVDRQRTELQSFEELPANDLRIVGRWSRAIGRDAVMKYLAFAGQARARVAVWAEPKSSAPVLSLILYSEPEDLIAYATPNALSTWNPVGNAVHALCAPSLPHDGGAAIARASACAWLGEPAEPWLADGAGTDAALSWWNSYLERWVSWLHRGGLVPKLEEITDAHACERLSPHLVVPVRAALFRFLLETRGAAFVRDLWRGTARLSIDADLERAFQAHWTSIDMRYRESAAARRTARAGASTASAFSKGVALESASADPERGFGSRRCEQSLSEIRLLGANAIAVSSFCAAERDPPRLAGLGVEHGFAPLEGDVGLYAALSSAKYRGFTTLFSPHLLSAPGGSWNGAWVRGTKSAWEEFFTNYQRFVVHCALLCELAQVDVLSLGSDMPDIARGTAEGRRARPEEVEEKSAGWKQVIAAARGAFAGRITYAASSVAEAQKIAFWGDLDAVGLELFYPPSLPGREEAQDPRGFLLWNLTRDLEDIEKVAEAQGKPLLITQVGFTASGSGPRIPRNGPGSVDVDQQAEAFAMLESALPAFAARRRLQGVFVWRWSTDPGDRGVNARDYLFRQRPAALVVTRMFGGL